MGRQVRKPRGQADDPVGRLAALLRGHVGHYVRGSQLPSRAELARQFGVTVRQASQAVQVLIDEGLVRSSPRGGTFVTNEAASAAAIRRVIAVVQPLPPPQAVQQAILLGAGRECAARQLPFHVVGGPRDAAHASARGAEAAADPPPGLPAGLPDLDRSDCLAELVGEDPRRVGWMFLNLRPSARSLLDWRIGDVPLVLVDEAPAEQPTHTVCPDVQGAVFRAAESLVLLGHRRIAYVGSFTDGGAISAGRVRGFRAALERHGLRADESLLWDDGAGRSDDTRRMLRRALQADRAEGSGPTGVVAANQRIGCDLLAVCDELAVSVPGQLSVICSGLERRELPAEAVARLSCWTTGRPEDLGRLAVDLLARSHELPGPVSLLAGCTWLDRGSAGPPPAPAAARRGQ